MTNKLFPDPIPPMQEWSGRGPYVCILMDPNWNERGGGKIKRGADRHYPVMKTPDIRNLILSSGAFQPAQDCHLWMWATNNYLGDALWLYEQLGFRYLTNFPWTKGELKEIEATVDGQDRSILEYRPGKMGIGQYGRGCHELLLFGVKGRGLNACTVYPEGHPKAGKMRRDIRTDWLVGKPHERDPDTGKVIHSRKPRAQYELIDARTKAGPRLEMFARTRHSDAWDVWGNEAPEP